MQPLTASGKLLHASGLYMDGIRDGRIWEALEAHTGARYTQHSTGVGDGREGFAEFFVPFVAKNPRRDIRVVRAIEDGPYVFLHVYQNLNDGAAQWITADLFDTDRNDLVIEHWDVIQAYEPRTKSGRDMLDGPSDIEDLDRTGSNKSAVRSFCETCLVGGDFERAPEFISGTEFLQHNLHVADGVEGWVAHFARMAATGETVRYWNVHKLVGQGSFVVTMSHLQMGRSHYCVFDIFRLADGLIVEHWDVAEKILAPEEWNNQGKF